MRSRTIRRMNQKRLLGFIALLGVSQVILAGPVNKCKLPDGRVMMTDRPCGDPATERRRERHAQGSADEIDADEIFSARKKIGKAPLSPGLIDSHGNPPATDRAPTEVNSKD